MDAGAQGLDLSSVACPGCLAESTVRSETVRTQLEPIWDAAAAGAGLTGCAIILTPNFGINTIQSLPQTTKQKQITLNNVARS